MNAEATMMPMTVRQVAEAVQGRLIVPQTGDGVEDGADALATSAVSDSRQVREGSVFVAIAGERVDGHDFVARAGESGAVVALVQHEVDAPVAQIVVPDTVDALGLLAKANIAARRAVGTPFTLIGITGSVGKTTTKDLMAALLSTLGPTVAPVGSFNNEIGLPLTALKVGRDTRFFVAEMGASHVGEITRLTTIAPPDIAVVLKVGCAHLGEFGSVERIAQAKSEIVQGLVPMGWRCSTPTTPMWRRWPPWRRKDTYSGSAWPATTPKPAPATPHPGSRTHCSPATCGPTTATAPRSPWNGPMAEPPMCNWRFAARTT